MLPGASVFVCVRACVRVCERVCVHVYAHARALVCVCICVCRCAPLRLGGPCWPVTNKMRERAAVEAARAKQLSACSGDQPMSGDQRKKREHILARVGVKCNYMYI